MRSILSCICIALALTGCGDDQDTSQATSTASAGGAPSSPPSIVRNGAAAGFVVRTLSSATSTSIRTTSITPPSSAAVSSVAPTSAVSAISANSATLSTSAGGLNSSGNGASATQAPAASAAQVSGTLSKAPPVASGTTTSPSSASQSSGQATSSKTSGSTGTATPTVAASAPSAAIAAPTNSSSVSAATAPSAPAAGSAAQTSGSAAQTSGSAAQTSDSPSQTLTPTAAGTGWKTMSLVDLVTSSKANCTVQSSTLIACAGPLQVTALTNTTVDGAGVEIQFSDPTTGNSGITLTSANGAVLTNFKISWLGGGVRDAIVPGVNRLQSLGNVVACSNNQSGGVIALDLALNGTQPLYALSVWDNVKGWPWYQSASGDPEIYFPTNTTAQFSNGRSGCLPSLATFVGSRVLVRHTVTNHAFHCLGCQNITVQNVTIFSSPDMGFVFENGGSNISLINNVIAPRCSPNCALAEPSLIADAAHFADVSGNILLENNDFGWQGDDGLNVTGLLEPANLAQTQSGTGRWLQVGAGWQSRLWSMTVGSSLSLFDAGLASLGTVNILAVDPASGLIEVSSLPPSTTNFIIARTDGIPKNVVIRGNQFHDSRARGILIGGSNALISNNLIERVTMEAILVDADTGPWYEGPGAQNVTIQDNTIASVNRFPATAYPDAISAGISIPVGFSGSVGTPIQGIVVQSNSVTSVYTNPNALVSMGLGALGTILQ